jgi:DNA-binding MarR family transcriptional regulator
MIEEAPGITRLIDRLEIKGLVRRQRCAEDRRQVLCWLTTEGRALVDRIDEPMDTADDDAVGMLSSDEQTTLCKLLDKIRAGHRA